MKASPLENPRLFCSFRVEGKLYGVDILDVKEVTTEMMYTRIAHAPDEVLGLVNIRGHIHLALDLRRLLGEAARRWTHSYIDYKQLKSAIKRDVAAQGEHRQLLPLLLLGGSWLHWQGGRRLQGMRLQGLRCHVKLVGS